MLLNNSMNMVLLFYAKECNSEFLKKSAVAKKSDRYVSNPRCYFCLITNIARARAPLNTHNGIPSITVAF